MMPVSPKPCRVLAWPYTADKAQNPYASLLYMGLEETGEVAVSEFSLKRLFTGRWEVIHIHWPDGFWPRHALAVSALFALVFMTGLALARLKGARLVWTTHNLAAHERRNDWVRRIYMRAFTRLCDGMISLSRENRDAILQSYPYLAHKQVLVVPHGLYDAHYPQCALSREACRDRLELPEDTDVLLALGNMRPYKGYPDLIAAFRALPEKVRAKWTLLIVGKAGEGHGAELRQLADGEPAIVIRDAFVPDDEIGVYMTAATLVILPYRQMQNSGAANLAVTFGRPVVAPDINSFQDMAQEFPQMLHLFSGKFDVTKLENALQCDGPDAAPDWQALRHEITDKTLGFYKSLVG